MNTQYTTELKRKLCIDICVNGKSTIKTAEEYNIPLKTLEKWITAFNKDNYCFNPKMEENNFKIIDSPTPNSSYDNLSNCTAKLKVYNDRGLCKKTNIYV